MESHLFKGIGSDLNALVEAALQRIYRALAEPFRDSSPNIATERTFRTVAQALFHPHGGKIQIVPFGFQKQVWM